MSRLIMISGFPSTGKTTGVMTLDPKSTVFLDGDGKGMAWVG
jgi:hypothetical protein